MNQQETTASSSPGASVYGPLAVRRDRLGCIYVRPRPVSFDPVARFARFQSALLAGELACAGFAAVEAAHLIAFNGISIDVEVERALRALPNAYSMDDGVFMDWIAADGRRDRRELAAVTIRYLNEDGHPALRLESWRQDLADALRPFYLVDDPVAALLADATRWVSSVESGTLIGHTTRLAPMTALSRETLARGATGRALALVVPEAASAGVSGGLATAIEGYFTSEGSDLGDKVLERLAKSCRPRGKGTDAAKKNRMLQAAMDLAADAVAEGPIASLVVWWAIDFIESGTEKEPDVSPNTIPKYVPVICHVLAPKLRGIDIGEASSKQRYDLYKGLCDAATPSERRTVSAALRCWDNFLQRWLDIEPLRGSLVVGHVDPPPAANVVWPHEKSRIRGWVAAATCDERLAGQIQAAFEIGFEARVRAGELVILRLRNFEFHADAIEISISPLPRDGRLKSDSARRPLTITDASACDILRKWFQRRRKEGALTNDLFFGDPHAPDKVYRLGQFFVAVNRTLKAATGDSSVSFHALSHTYASEEGEVALANSEPCEINPLDDIATSCAHLFNHTTTGHYVHRYERVLRTRLDRGIERVDIPSRIAARWSGISDHALRKRVERSRRSTREVYWEAIRASVDVSQFPGVAEGLTLEDPTIPPILSMKKDAGLEIVLCALGDLSAKWEWGSVASRCGQTPEWVTSVALAAAEQLALVGMGAGSSRRGASPSAERGVAMLQSLHGHGSGSVDFGRIEQPKLEKLRAFLEGNGFSDATEAAQQAWVRSLRGGYVSLENPSDAAHIFLLLKEAGVPASELGMCVAVREAMDGTAAQHEDSAGGDPGGRVRKRFADAPCASEEMQSHVTAAFEANWSIPPFSFDVVPRRGRPVIYLLWASHRIQIDAASRTPVLPPPAASSLGGFNALMLALGVLGTLGRFPME